MKTPAVLVVVPSYNHGAFIGARIESILNQTHPDFELRVIDDCSSDETMDVLSRHSDDRLTIDRRASNSGSPFTAWLDASEMLAAGDFDFIWIAESDDRAESKFLERGVEALKGAPDAALYYCHSWFIDEADLIIGHSINYLNRTFQSLDWNSSWRMPGSDFIRTCLVKGMAIPNMSSALIRADAFKAAVRSTFVRYKLAADWVFAIHASLCGDVLFDPWDGNYFRHHARTSRRETDLSRMLFEHMSATRTAFKSGTVDRSTYSERMRVWSDMYSREGGNFADFVKWGWRISRSDLAACLVKLSGI